MARKINRRGFVKSGVGVLALGGVAKVTPLAQGQPPSTNKPPKKRYTRKEAVSMEWGGKGGGVRSGPAGSDDSGQTPDASASNGVAAASEQEPVQQAAGPVKVRNIKKAILHTATYGDPPLIDTFKMFRDAGFQGVKLTGGMNQKQVLAARDATGLEIPAVWSMRQEGRPLSDRRPGVLAEAREGLRAALLDCKAYGGSLVPLVPAVVSPQVEYAEAYARSQDEIEKVLPLAKDLGIKIAITNGWRNHFLMSPLEAQRYVDELGSDALAWCVDVGNIAPWGWPEQWIRILGKRVQGVVIRDFNRAQFDSFGTRAMAVDYLDGDVNWPAVMKALDDIEFSGWAMIEPTFSPPGLNYAKFLVHVRERVDRILGM